MRGQVTYRVGNHNPRNLYRDDEHFGVVFDPADGPLVVEALNGLQPAICLTWLGETAQACELPHGHVGACGLVADSCTCPFLSGRDPDCPVHQGRRARGPKPPPLGEGCICDGSGRTCPRHGAVI
jgi:hypothetical protein